jgi:hypothetical protein
MHTKTTFNVALLLLKLLKLYPYTCFDPMIIVTIDSTIILFTVRQVVHFAPHRHISYALNTTILHASTSTISYLQYFYNYITFNETFNKILTYNI